MESGVARAVKTCGWMVPSVLMAEAQGRVGSLGAIQTDRAEDR